MSGLLLFSHYVTISPWTLVPFFILLFLLATGPSLFPQFWHESYKMVSVSLGLVVGFWYVYTLKQEAIVIESLFEFISFISLLFALYVVSGSIYLLVDYESSIKANLIFLAAGAILSNFIGTTGASVLLIRPFIRLNRYNIQGYHIVFFIFMVSNCGGLLTPIGDPPLLIGYLKGVPFLYTLTALWLPWLFVNGVLLVVFYFIDKKNKIANETGMHYSNKLLIEGERNIIWLILILLSVFLDPRIFNSLPTLVIKGHHFSYVREVMQLCIATACLITGGKKTRASNEFSFEPILEITFIFFGIFLTMIPVSAYLEMKASSGLSFGKFEMYLATGFTSAFLDNAPAYLNMLTAAMSSHGASIQIQESVQQFSRSENAIWIGLISTASVFFGALTYIGNGPNLMIRAIAVKIGIEMPSFGKYMIRYSIPILLPLIMFAGLFFLL